MVRIHTLGSKICLPIETLNLKWMTSIIENDTLTLGVSIIICCFNSAKRLPETLKHLSFQIVPPNIPWEIIIVDNASNDTTLSTAKEEWEKYEMHHVGFRVLEQSIPGKNYAFKMGLETAAYEYILTCDDDNWLANNYIETAFRIINADKAIGALGGLGIVEPEQPTKLNKEELNQLTVNGSQTWASSQHWVYGAGSLYRRSILIGLFDRGWQQITSGRTGKKLISGEDVEICFMIYLSGFKIVADDRLIFKHFVPLKRQTTDFITDMAFWFSYTNVLLNSYFVIIHNDDRPIKKILDDWLLGISKTLFKKYILEFGIRFKIWKKPSTQQKIALLILEGTFYSLFKNRKRIIHHHYHTKNILAQNSNI
jgi:glycosyltransferase involved in cell wall biosynthesis